jgi:hypothetical protein
MKLHRVRFTVGTMMIAVAALGIVLMAARWSPHDLFHASGMIVVGLFGLSPIVICYLWLRESPGRGPSASVEILIGRFAVVLVAGVVFWAIVALWAGPMY